jgi:hypothetical protein
VVFVRHQGGDVKESIGAGRDRQLAGAAGRRVEPDVVKLPRARHGLVCPPQRRTVERALARLAECRRPAGLHLLALLGLLLTRHVAPVAQVQN